MQADMVKAQEELKDEVVEASRRRRHGDRQGHRRPRAQGDHDRPRGASIPRTSRCSRTWCSRPSTRRSLRPGARRRARWAALTGGLGGLGRPRRPRPARPLAHRLFAPPVNRLITELAQAARHRPAHRAAARLPHPARLRARTRSALADAIREVKETIGLCEICFNLAEGPRCRICQDERRDRVADLRRRGARRRDPDRAHARVPRPSTTCSAARCRRSTASTPRTCKIAELRRRASRTARCSEVVIATNPTTTGEATAFYIAEALRELGRRASRSRASRAGCRWAPTSSTPTRSRSARRSPAAARCRRRGEPPILSSMIAGTTASS